MKLQKKLLYNTKSIGAFNFVALTNRLYKTIKKMYFAPWDIFHFLDQIIEMGALSFKGMINNFLFKRL